MNVKFLATHLNKFTVSLRKKRETGKGKVEHFLLVRQADVSVTDSQSLRLKREKRRAMTWSGIRYFTL